MQCNVDIQNKEFPSDSLTNANKVYDMVARPLMSGIFSVVCGMFDISGRVIENVHHNSKVRGTEQKLEYFQRKLETIIHVFAAKILLFAAKISQLKL